MFVVFKCKTPSAKNSRVIAAWLMQTSPETNSIVTVGNDLVYYQTDVDDTINKIVNNIDKVTVNAAAATVIASKTCTVSFDAGVSPEPDARALGANWDDRVGSALVRAASTTALANL